MTRPRVRAADGSGELHLPPMTCSPHRDPRASLAMEKMLAGLVVAPLRPRPGARRAGRGAGGRVAPRSRRSPAGSWPQPRPRSRELMSRRLDGLDLVAFMADGVHFGEHTCVVGAWASTSTGSSIRSAVEEGSTENATLVTDLITGLRDRGLDVTKPILAVIDGPRPCPARSRTCSISRSFTVSAAQDQQCKGQAAREARARSTEKRMREAYHAESALKAEGRAPGAGPRAGQDPSRRRRIAARGHGRDPDHPAAGRAAHPGPHAPLHEHHRVDDRDLPGSTPGTSSGGGTGPWPCAGAPPE